MSYLRIGTLAGTSVVLAMLLALTGCGGDRREHVRPHEERRPERYERRDSDRHEERRDIDRREDRGRPSGHERGNRDER